MIHSVCVLGDSVAKGVVLDAAHQKYMLLKNSFVHEIQRAAHLSVKNLAKFGCTIGKGAQILKRHKEELSQYDYTVLEFGGNDCDFNWSKVAADPDAGHEPQTPISEFEQSYCSMIREVRQSGGAPVLLTLPPIVAPRYFAWISQGLNAENILRWLGDVEHIYRWHEMYNLAVCRAAMQENAPLIDISSEFLSMTHYQDLICADGIHPNEQGHRLIAQSIERFVKQHFPRQELALA